MKRVALAVGLLLAPALALATLHGYYLHQTNGLMVPFCDGSGTSGNQTLNSCQHFKARFAAGATSITITNDRTTATSDPQCTLQTADATCTGAIAAVPGAGSVVLTVPAACTAVTVVGCFMWN